MEKDGRVLIRNLSEKDGIAKMRSFREDKVHVVIENLNSKNITNKVHPENDLNGKIHTFQSNILLSCDDPVDNYNWSIIDEDHISNHKSKEDIKSKSSDAHTETKDRLKNVMHNRSRGNKEERTCILCPRNQNWLEMKQ